MAGSASVEAEDKFVEVALEMLSSQSMIDAERPGLGVGDFDAFATPPAKGRSLRTAAP